MGGALFRFEAVETDGAVDTLPFTGDSPQSPQFRYQHAAVDTAHDTLSSHFRLYSRYTFLHVFTALQVIFGLFTVFLFNYLSTIRYHYAPRMDNITQQLVEHPNWTIAPIYLGGCVLGLSFVVFAALYIICVNSEFYIEKEQRRWLQDKQAPAQKAKPNTSSASPAPHAPNTQSYRKETIGSRVRRIGVRWVSCARPYYAFHTQYLPDFDFKHNLRDKYGERPRRSSPQNTLFFCMWPVVLILTILDFVTIDELRFSEKSASLLEGVAVFLGLLYMIYAMRYVIMNGMRNGCNCFRYTTNDFSH